MHGRLVIVVTLHSLVNNRRALLVLTPTIYLIQETKLHNVSILEHFLL